MNDLFGGLPEEALSEKIVNVDQELEELFHPFREYFNWTPEEVNHIAYWLKACYEERLELFVDVDPIALNRHLDTAHKIRLKLPPTSSPKNLT